MEVFRLGCFNIVVQLEPSEAAFGEGRKEFCALIWGGDNKFALLLTFVCPFCFVE